MKSLHKIFFSLFFRVLSSTVFFYVLFFLFFELSSYLNWVSPALIPAPHQLIDLFFSPESPLLEPLIKTALYSMMAFILSSLIALVLGLLIHRFNYLKKIITPLTLFFQTVPIIAMAPLLVIYIGFGAWTILSAALIVCFFPVLSATLIGLNQINVLEEELFLFYEASELQKILKLKIPSALPTLQAGLRTSAGLSVVGVVSGEFVAGGGLGGLIDSARLQQRVDLVFAALILLSLIGLFLMKITEFLFQIFFKKYLKRS